MLANLFSEKFGSEQSASLDVIPPSHFFNRVSDLRPACIDDGEQLAKRISLDLRQWLIQESEHALGRVVWFLEKHSNYYKDSG